MMTGLEREVQAFHEVHKVSVYGDVLCLKLTKE